MFRRIIQRIIRYSQAGKESDTEYYGFLSYAVEWHALAWGSLLGATFVVSLAWSPEIARSIGLAIGVLVVYGFTGRRLEQAVQIEVPEPVEEQVAKEPHYFAGGLGVGALIGLAAAISSGTLPLLLEHLHQFGLGL